MERQGKGTNGFIILAKHHTEKKIMRINICNKISTGAILRSKKNNLCSGKGEKDETENEKMFWFKFEDRVSGEGLKELDEKK